MDAQGVRVPLALDEFSTGRLKWVKLNKNWWPGLFYSNCGSLLKHKAKSLPAEAKNVLAIEALSDNPESVAQIFGVNRIVFAHRTKDFFQNVNYAIDSNKETMRDSEWRAFQKAKDIVLDALKKSAAKKLNVVPPDRVERSLDYHLEAERVSKKRRHPSEIPSRKKSRKTDEGRVWGREPRRDSTRKNTTERVRKHEKHMTDAIMMNDDFYSWPNIWGHLRQQGWRHKQARNPLHDWYYLKPGVDIKTGEAGVDYFVSKHDLITYTKKIDLRNQVLGDEEESVQGSIESGRVTLSSEEDVCEVRDDESGNRGHESSTRPVDPTWFQRGPDFGFICKRLGIGWKGYKYILPGVSEKPRDHEKFDHEDEVRKFLCSKGIPMFEATCKKLTEEEKNSIVRWVQFANVPTKNGALEKLRRLELISSNEAIDLVTKKLPFLAKDDGTIVDELSGVTWSSEEEFRAHLRGLPDWTRSKAKRRTSDQVFSDRENLSLRLWAATSDQPLPIYQDPSNL